MKPKTQKRVAMTGLVFVAGAAFVDHPTESIERTGYVIEMAAEVPAEFVGRLAGEDEAEHDSGDETFVKYAVLGGIGLYGASRIRRRVNKMRKFTKQAIKISREGFPSTRVDLSQPPEEKPPKSLIPDWVIKLAMAPVNAYEAVQDWREQRVHVPEDTTDFIPPTHEAPLAEPAPPYPSYGEWLQQQFPE